MHSPHPEIVVEHLHARAVVSFVARVSESSIIHLVRIVNELRYQRFYRDVELQIASPGGDVLALQYFVEALSQWRDDGFELTTRALTSCSSAAAVMLSLGDRRKASPTSHLLYHFARYHVDASVPITRARAHLLAESLDLTDSRILKEIVSRAACNRPQAHEFGVEDRNALNEIRAALDTRRDDRDSLAWLRDWVATTCEACDRERRARWQRLYRVLCESERSISGRLAHALGLVDELIAPMARARPARPIAARSLPIPEWRTLFPGGAVDVRDLKRHTLVLGETGSGKTASAVLPVLVAAYGSAEVGVALVVDPKHELGAELERLKKSGACSASPRKRIVRIKPDEIAIDLMASEAWSIARPIADQRYWSAAERVLQRVAGLSASNPAQLLLGKPPQGRDPYWEREGLRLATAVIAIAIEWVVDWPTIAQVIKHNLNASMGGPRHRGWETVLRCFTRIHPHAFVLDPKWTDWIALVRAQYANDFGMVPSRVRDEDGHVRIAWVPTEHARASERSDPRHVRFETDILDFIEEVDERRRWEEATWRQLREQTTTASQRSVIDSLSAIYRTRIRHEREALKNGREAAQREVSDRLSADDVRAEMIRVVDARLGDDVGERTEAQWRALLADALDRRICDIKEAAEAQRTSAKQRLRDDAAYNCEDCSRELSAIVHSEEQDVEQALAALVMERLRDAGAGEWDAFVAAAKHGRVRFHGPSSTFAATTTFLEVLDGFEKLMAVFEGVGSAAETPNLMAIAALILDELFSAGDVRKTEDARKESATVIPTGAEHIEQTMRGRGGEWEKTADTVARFTDLRNTTGPQYAGCLGAAGSILYEFSRPGLERVVFFGCEPSVTARAQQPHDESGNDGRDRAQRPTLLDFRDAVSNRGSSPGVIYVYQPSRHKHDELIAKACKTLFFEAVLDSAERREADHAMPLAGYIADEFQRFITADPVHGEQSFLDVCRSFGAFAVLASQSVASLRYALRDLEPDADKRNSAIDIICGNTGTKMFFRTSDEETSRRTRTISPILPDGKALIESRPLSTLGTGECYASFSDGRFERVQVDPYAGAPGP